MADQQDEPSLGWAITLYAGAAFIGYRWMPDGGWPVAMVAIFFLRGASDAPLFRDDYAFLLGNSPAHNRERRLNSLENRILRFLGDMVGRLFGLLFAGAFFLGILMQGPEACSGPTAEPEYRAR